MFGLEYEIEFEYNRTQMCLDYETPRTSHNIQNDLDDWKLPKVSNQEIYKKGTFKFFTDYTIKELRQFICLGLSDLQDQINRIGNQEIHMDIPESSYVNDNETDTFLNTISRVIWLVDLFWSDY